MRIGEPARRHGVADEDIWHAVRNAMRRLDNDVTILIGPTRDGALLEIGVLGIDGDDPVIVSRDAAAAQVLPLPVRTHATH
jgi:hypothetical protein